MKTLVKTLNVVINDSSLPVFDFNDTPIIEVTKVLTGSGQRAQLLDSIGELDLGDYVAEVYFHANPTLFSEFNVGIVSNDQYANWISSEEGVILRTEWNNEIAPYLPTSRTFTLHNTLSTGAFAIAYDFTGTVDITIWKVAE